MARRSTRKKRGNKSPIVADESGPEASTTSSTSTSTSSKRKMKTSAGAPESGPRRETRSSTATKDKAKATAKWKGSNGTDHEVLEPPTKKSKNSRALGSTSASASSSGSGSQNSTKASTSKSLSSSSSESPEKKPEIGKDLYPFPTEIYELIFKELKGPHLKDRHNVSNATPEWRELLKNDRVLFLFPQVFEILHEKRFTDLEFISINDRFGDEGFSTGDLRLVCKSWNESIQHYVQLNPVHLHVEPFEDNDKRTKWTVAKDYRFSDIKGVYRFYGTEQITEFMDKHQATHSSEHNPFFVRLVEFQQEGDRISEAEQKEFWNTVVNLLLTYGKHIYYFEVTFDDPMTPVKCIQLLHRVLSLLPNIKSLTIDYNQSNSRAATERERRQIVREIGCGEIEFPKLANLQVLQMTNLPDVIAQHLIQKNGHIKQLKIQIPRGLSIRFSTMFQGVSMSREFETLHINLQTREDIEDLQRSLGASPVWPLKSLFIFFSLKEHLHDEAPFFPLDQWPQWSSIFRLIEHKFGETLLNLMIQLPESELDEDKNLLRDAAASTLRLNLPYLRQLNVKLPNPTSIDFLLGVKDTLEEVTVKVTYSDKLSVVERRREKIKFNGMFEKMERSNIWKVLPKLNKLVVELYKEDRLRRRGCFCCGPPDSDRHSYARTEAGIAKVDDY